MTDKQIIDGLACANCSEAERCQEQQAKKEYAINQVLQDIPTEYANVIARLKQIIPSVTRCDYVLEKQLKRKEQECEEFRKANDEKNELLAKLGCPTVATARSKVYILENLIKVFKAELEQYKKSKQASYEEMQKRWQEAEKRSRKLENELSEAKKMLEFYQGCFAGKGGK